MIKIKKKKIFIIINILICIFLTTGCWDYRELKDLWVASSIAIDRNTENNNYIISTETIRPHGSEELKMSTNITTIEGKTIFDAIRNTIIQSGKKLYWSHAKTVIISEKIAKEGIVPIIDFFVRHPEPRLDMFLIISKEDSAKKILEKKTGLELFETTAYQIEETLQSQENISKYYAVELLQFINDLSSEGLSPILPTVNLKKTKRGENIEVNGTAIFKKDKMIGWLNGSETKNMLFIKNKLKGGLLIISNVDNTKENVTLEILNNKTKIKPIMQDGQIIMNIDVNTDVNIDELTGTIDFISKEGREKLNKQAEKTLQKQLQSLIKKVQEKYNSDIFGFGNIIQKEMPNTWKEINFDWDNIFRTLETSINVNINIRGSSLTSKPLKIGD